MIREFRPRAGYLDRRVERPCDSRDAGENRPSSEIGTIMEHHRGYTGLAVLVGFFGVLIGDFTALVARGAVAEFPKANLLAWAIIAFRLLAGLGTSLLLLAASRELFASFRVDDRGITRRWLGFETGIAWPEVDRFTETIATRGGAPGRYILFASDGRRLAITIVGLPRGDRLRERLEKHLAPSRERRRQEIADLGWRVRPDRIGGLCILGLVAPMFLLEGLASLLGPLPGNASSDLDKGLAMLAVAVAPIAGVIGLELLSRVLTLSDSAISQRILFGRREIALDRVESIVIRLALGHEPRGVVATIRGEGRSIFIHSSTPGYNEILDVLSARTGIAPVRVEDAAGHKAKSMTS
jgi:hypothetical protein